ncbi:MAG: serine/threonine-protein kinase [Chloroflexota bacterium]
MTIQMIGRYEVKMELARGGMAAVLLAYDPRFERDVAIKLLPREFLHESTFRARFEREAKLIAALEHPAIVPVYDYGEADGQPFLVMRHMAGGSLTNRIQKGPMPASEVAAILQRIGAALDHAHSKGIIHRDLKPSNILFDQFGLAYLSDFGIARLAESSTTLTGAAWLGTPAYMSPEQARAEGKLDGRSDLYALGVILFEMLTGQTPYKADTPMGMALKHVVDPVPRIRDVKADLPPAYEEVIARSMAKNPNERFATASALVTAVNNLANQPADGSRPAAQRPSSLKPSSSRVPAKPATRSGQKRLRWVWLAGALGLLALCVISALLILSGDNSVFSGLGRQPTSTPSPTPTRETAPTETATGTAARPTDTPRPSPTLTRTPTSPPPTTTPSPTEQPETPRPSPTVAPTLTPTPEVVTRTTATPTPTQSSLPSATATPPPPTNPPPAPTVNTPSPPTLTPTLAPPAEPTSTPTLAPP